jgi:MFS transporter, Spinster family, sphingosine-1-phosphate transporter
LIYSFFVLFCLKGVLKETQQYFKINDAESGSLQTAFICSYMLLAPLFGYLGDRYPRKWLIIFGISFWSAMTLIGSFVPPDKFWLFVIIRSLVGIGEASYSCVAPTIIGDLFTTDSRTQMLALFYLAVPVGSGMGYIVGSNVAYALGDWRWALRVTPPLGFICIILLILVVKEPKRGGAEGASFQDEAKSSIIDDTIYLLKNRSFMWTTMGFTFASFVLGGLSWWVPTYVEYAIYSNNQEPKQIPLIFGLITCFGGLFGVGASSALAPKLRTYISYGDPIICALGSIIAVPGLFILLIITRAAPAWLFWSLAAVSISAMCLSWTIVADILLYVVYPTRRSFASALNMLICHLLGDAGSPYIIGFISDHIRGNKPDTYYNRFTSLQTALYAGPFFAALSFGAYLFTAIYIDADRKSVDAVIKSKRFFLYS